MATPCRWCAKPARSACEWCDQAVCLKCAIPLLDNRTRQGETVARVICRPNCIVTTKGRPKEARR